MVDADTPSPSAPRKSRWGLFSRTRRSIRTQYSLATAFFLLVILAAFYIGGRIVLVRLVRETEDQVKAVGSSVSQLAYRNADRMKVAQAGRVGPIASAFAQEGDPEGRSGLAVSIMENPDAVGPEVSLVVGYAPDGTFLSAAQRCDGGVRRLESGDFSAYGKCLSAWLGRTPEATEHTPVGIMCINGVSHYVMFVSDAETGVRLVLGAPFDLDDFSTQVNEGFGSYNIRLERSAGKGAEGSVQTVASGDGAGFSSMLSEALNYYSGGFWSVSGDPFEAVFAVRDVAGNTITTIYISLPRTFSSVTGMAIERLTLFVAIAGILIILPIFWIQGRVLLNPLSRMTEELKRLSARREDADCPRLEWEGQDEFAHLAESVNRLLETISVRTVSLTQLKLRQHAMIEGVPDALCIFDTQGRLVDINKQPEGVPPLPGVRMNETLDGAVFGPEGVARFRAELDGVFDGGTVGRVRLEDCAFAGEAPQRRQFEVRLTRMDAHFALAIVRDVTREVLEVRRREEAEQRALDVVKRESLALLAAGIAHDVNNILSVILSTAEGAFAERGECEEVRVVRDAVKRGQAMTRELMAFAGQSRVALQRATAEMVVKDVMALAERMVPENVTLDYSLAKDVPDVDVDPNQFWKVLFNIVKNAGEALGDRRGCITISTAPFEMTAELAGRFVSETSLPPGRGVMFRISDNGPGIRPDLLPRLFDPYVSSKAMGRGLGLATVRTIVEAHGGGIQVTSVPEQGTTFHIFLPETRLPTEQASAVRPVATGELPSSVLVVDNDESILKTCSILLKALKVEAHVARGRKDALGFLRRHSAEVGAIILDAHLGGIDTVRLLEAFRIAAPGVRVVLSSGSREEDMREMFAAHPFDIFLGKPYTLMELKAALLK